MSWIGFLTEGKEPCFLRCLLSEEEPDSVRRSIHPPELRRLRQRRLAPCHSLLNDVFSVLSTRRDAAIRNRITGAVAFNLFQRDGFFRLLYEFFKAGIAAQRIPERMQTQFVGTGSPWLVALFLYKSEKTLELRGAREGAPAQPADSATRSLPFTGLRPP